MTERTPLTIPQIARGWRIVRAYLVGFAVVALAMFIIGSFVIGDWWNPFGTAYRRASVAWLGLVGIIVSASGLLNQDTAP